MGDRCYLQITTDEQYAGVIESAIGQDYHDDDGDGWVYTVEEANYALNDELEAACKAGAIFYGWHSDGSEYPACRFASDGEEFTYIACNVEQYISIEMQPDGTLRDADVVEARNFLLMDARATKHIATLTARRAYLKAYREVAS